VENTKDAARIQAAREKEVKITGSIGKVELVGLPGTLEQCFSRHAAPAKRGRRFINYFPVAFPRHCALEEIVGQQAPGLERIDTREESAVPRTVSSDKQIDEARLRQFCVPVRGRHHRLHLGPESEDALRLPIVYRLGANSIRGDVKPLGSVVDDDDHEATIVGGAQLLEAAGTVILQNLTGWDSVGAGVLPEHCSVDQYGQPRLLLVIQGREIPLRWPTHESQGQTRRDGEHCRLVALQVRDLLQCCRHPTEIRTN
jgi:hypothetical protein